MCILKSLLKIAASSEKWFRILKLFTVFKQMFTFDFMDISFLCVRFRVSAVVRMGANVIKSNRKEACQYVYFSLLIKQKLVDEVL